MKLSGKHRIKHLTGSAAFAMSKTRLAVVTMLLAIFIVMTALMLQGNASTENVSEGMRYQVETLTNKLGVPWGMVFIADDTIIFTERGGKVGTLQTGNGKITYLNGAPDVWARGQGGMLDMALPPGYVAGGWIYFTYSKPLGNTSATTLARAKLTDNNLIEWRDLLITESASKAKRHFGSRIAFDGNGHLFFTIGDRGHRPNGQDLSSHAGSVLRLNLDGSVPADNPFIDTPGALPEIWSYGHRNPQGIFFDQQNQRLWLNEHGPRGGDEINLVLPGQNYGWPITSHGKEYHKPGAVGEGKYKPGIEAPKKVYIPSIAPGSLLLYTGDAFPLWRGNLFSGALKLTHLNRLTVDGSGNIVGEERLLETRNERIRNVIQSPEGWLYVSTDSGKILIIKPAINTE